MNNTEMSQKTMTALLDAMRATFAYQIESEWTWERDNAVSVMARLVRCETDEDVREAREALLHDAELMGGQAFIFTLAATTLARA